MFETDHALPADAGISASPPAKPKADEAAIQAALSALFYPGDVVELRALHSGKKRTAAGYFDAKNWPELAAHACDLNSRGAAVYVTLNPVDPQLLNRYSNRMQDYAQATTTDKQVIRRRWLLIDIDPTRPSGTSASDTQVDAARAKATRLLEYLKARGWAAPMVAESGNGVHLLYPVDLPNDSTTAELLKAALVALGERFDDDVVKVDRSVFNAARICKLYGTVSNKGDHTSAAPHRLSKLTSTPPRGEVTAEQMAALMSTPTAVPAATSMPSSPLAHQPRSFRLEDFLARHGIEHTHDHHDGRERFRLAACPFNPEHVNGQAAVFRDAAGKLGFRCQHDSCASKGWRDVRELLDGPRVHRGAHNPDDSGAQLIDRVEAIKRARALLAPALKEHDAPPYPVAALGPLADACEAIATAGQVQAAMAGQCLLGAASLLTQGLFNVETLNGRRPLSLYLLTLGDSGDGKSTAQGAALGPVNEWQRKQAKAYAEDLRDFESAKAKRKKNEEPPEAPACPYRLVGDATVEGLRRDLDTGVCSQGVFTDEAAAILSGYGMSADHRSKTAGVFSKLWDNGHLSVSRVTGGRVERYGRRIALHWLIQPMAASESIGDPLLAALGFWPRFLAAWPAPQDPRKAQAFRPESLPAVTEYWARCDALLAMALPDDAGDCPTLALSEDARAVLAQAFERFELDARRGGLRAVRPFALRASEQACRLAGVLTAFQCRDEVSGDAIRGALALVAYSLKTWLAVIDQGAADPSAAHALRLYEWLTERPGWCESPAVIINAGPTCVRTKDKRDAALAVLEAAGLVEMLAGKAHALTLSTA